MNQALRASGALVLALATALPAHASDAELAEIRGQIAALRQAY